MRLTRKTTEGLYKVWRKNDDGKVEEHEEKVIVERIISLRQLELKAAKQFKGCIHTLENAEQKYTEYEVELDESAGQIIKKIDIMNTNEKTEDN